MTYDLFPQSIGTRHIAALTDKIAAYVPEVKAAHVPIRAFDKWVLSSNLQKSIRRGLAQVAIGTATRLLALDARYFWRRLLVIAYEDVGFANVGLCHDLLKFFRREAAHAQLGADRVAAYFVDTLCQSLKSRTLCDVIAMLEFNVRLGEYEKPWFGLSDDLLLDAICQQSELPITRIAALRHVCGYIENSKGVYRSITPARPELMKEVCRRLELTEMETTLFISGQSVSDSLNIPIPLVAQLARGGGREYQAEQVFEGEDGILFAAFDRHTRVGKKCFARFAQDVDAVRDFFQRQPSKLDPVAVIGVAVFIVEGSCLNCWVAFPQSDDLRRAFEQNFLEHAGVTEEACWELLTITRENLSKLNVIRALEAI